MFARKTTISYQNIVVSNISSHYVISLAYCAYNYNIKKIELFISKNGNTDFEHNSISIAQEKCFSTSQNSINHQPSFNNFKASISHNKST